MKPVFNFVTSRSREPMGVSIYSRISHKRDIDLVAWSLLLNRGGVSLPGVNNGFQSAIAELTNALAQGTHFRRE